MAFTIQPPTTPVRQHTIYLSLRHIRHGPRGSGSGSGSGNAVGVVVIVAVVQYLHFEFMVGLHVGQLSDVVLFHPRGDILRG